VTAEVNVPDEAVNVARDALRPEPVTTVDVERALHAAAPLIVAAELECIGVGLCQRQQEMRAEDDRSIRSAALGEAITVLRDRVAELRRESR
jgi:ferredoxin